MSDASGLAAGPSRESIDGSNAYASDAFESAPESEAAYEDDAFEEDDEPSTSAAEAPSENGEPGCDSLTEHNDSIPTANAQANRFETNCLNAHNIEGNAPIIVQAQATQIAAPAPPVDLHQVEYWCREKAQALRVQRSSRESNPHLKSTLTDSTPMLPSRVIASLALRLEERRRRSSPSNYTKLKSKSARIPNALMNRARVSRLASSSFCEENVQRASSLRRSSSTKSKCDSINTFCSVKSAELQGRLATHQLPGRCSKWETGDTDGGTSLAMVSFMAESIADQRKALQGDEPLIPCFQASFRHEALVEATIKQLQVSVGLRRQAKAVLNPLKCAR